MTSTAPKRALTLPAAGLALLILGLWGCASAPPPETARAEPAVAAQPPEAGRASLEFPPSRYRVQFDRAGVCLDTFDWMAAEVVLQEVPVGELAADDMDWLAYLRARIDFIRGDTRQAVSRLQGLDRPGVNSALRHRGRALRCRIHRLAGDYLASASLAEQLLRQATPGERGALRRDLWRDLQRLEPADLHRAAGEARDPAWKGWLELALLARFETVDAEAVQQWRDSHPGHPAAETLPGGLAYRLKPEPRPQRVALLLPLSGRLAPAGKAVRDGYLASYYTARPAGEGNPEVLIFDLDRFGSANAAYDEAVRRGAELVLGPLSKQAVAELVERGERPVPVLALNRVSAEAGGGSGAELVQFSLAPEDEAVRLAEVAYGRGGRRALVIRPAGEWGEKVEQVLLARWRELGGSLADSTAYGAPEEYSARVKMVLGIPTGEERARRVRDMLATNIEFTPRRRQDVDTVFLLAGNGAEARSLKPLLAFHYAGGLPVYATSSVYSGIADPRDRDLDGIQLVEMPWLLGASPGLRVAIAAGNTGSDAYTRLNALGADAYRLQHSLPLLQAGPDALLHGNTGLLSLDDRFRVTRELVPATFDRGLLRRQ